LDAPGCSDPPHLILEIEQEIENEIAEAGCVYCDVHGSDSRVGVWRGFVAGEVEGGREVAGGAGGTDAVAATGASD
jgi:hypothetical protein